MSFQKHILSSALALVLTLFSTADVRAQDFTLGVSSAPVPVTVGEVLTNTIYVTNVSGISWPLVYVTNAFTANVIFSGQSGTIAGAGFTNGNVIVFPITNFPAGFVEQLSITLLPQVAGNMTNRIAAIAIGGQPAATTNLSVSVTTPTVDLAVTMTNVASGLLATDVTTVGLTVTNRGANAATSVVVSNIYPATFALAAFTPTNASVGFTNGTLTWSIGSLASGSVTQLFASVVPGSSGTFSIVANVTSASADTNAANNSVTNGMLVDAVISTNLVITTVSAQTFNPQTGLMEETVTVRNDGTNGVPAVRVSVAGLGTNRLYNAVGTNSSGPYVQNNSALAVGASVNLLLEYFSRTRTPIANLTRTPIGVTATSLSIPTNSPPNISKVVLVPSGLLIEFQATPGKSYTVLYADNTSFTNAQVAQPTIVAPADRVQWIDNGPPKTVSAPAAVNQRYYRVVQNP